MGDLRGLIVFDLDGTLIDSERDLADAANALIRERGGAALLHETIGAMVGDGAAVLVRRALSAAGVAQDEAALPRFLELYDQRLVETTRPYPGIVPALQRLQAFGTLAVLTNKPLVHTRKLLNALGLAPFFSAAIGGDGPLPRKPDPTALNHLMTQYAVGLRATILVGDSPIDAATARNAGIAFCWARYGFGARRMSDPSEVAAVVTAPQELPSTVAGLLTT